MKIKTKDFNVKVESKNFIMIRRIMYASYDVGLILDLFEEMKDKGYKFICETEFDYTFIKNSKK